MAAVVVAIRVSWYSIKCWQLIEQTIWLMLAYMGSAFAEQGLNPSWTKAMSYHHRILCRSRLCCQIILNCLTVVIMILNNWLQVNAVKTLVMTVFG